jgi:hypothetical protein
VRLGPERLVEAGKAWPGLAWSGEAMHGMAGVARRGVPGHGRARIGEAVN